jgi:hypothetical protein
VAAGCGGGDETGGGRSPSTPVSTPAPPPRPAARPGPLTRICNRSLVSALRQIVSAAGQSRPRLAPPEARGGERLSQCEIPGAGGIRLGISLDSATDAPRRYRNRIAEASQFSSLDGELAPQPVRGVGAPDLGAAGADWLPAFHQLLSVRGGRLLIAEVALPRISDRAARTIAIAISLEVYRRLA